VTLIIADFDRRRVQRAAPLDFISNVLADLKGVYDRVDRGRTVIRSHQSAKTYGDEMRNFIEARVQLLNVVRALKFDERGVPIAGIHDNVVSMEQYLKTLIDEFEPNYKEISRSQSLYEARTPEIGLRLRRHGNPAQKRTVGGDHDAASRCRLHGSARE
jgi:hypothetical protein